MTSREIIDTTAVDLRSAYKSGPISPIRSSFADEDVGAAYDVQDINTEYWLAQGRQLAGRKIGLTSEAVQKQMGVDQPDYGMLYADMRITDGASVASINLIQPRVEAEVALLLKHDLTDPDMSQADVISAIDYIVPSIEIVDSRIHDWDISIVDTIADNASAGLYVMGDTRRTVADVDVVGCRMTLRCGDEIISQGAGKDCLGSPFISAFWLAQKMVEVGRPLLSGNIVLTGALGPMKSAEKGKTYVAEIEGIGSVSVAF